MPSNKPAKLFISYSHLDEDWKDRLERHLRVLELDETIEIWSDQQIEIGGIWRTELENQIESADLAILIISADFLISDFIITQELPRLIEQRTQNKTHIFPLLVGPCLWSTLNWLKELQLYPKSLKPLSAYDESDIDEKLAAFCLEVKYHAMRVQTSATLQKKSDDDLPAPRKSYNTNASRRGHRERVVIAMVLLLAFATLGSVFLNTFEVDQEDQSSKISGQTRDFTPNTLSSEQEATTLSLEILGAPNSREDPFESLENILSLIARGKNSPNLYELVSLERELGLLYSQFGEYEKSLESLNSSIQRVKEQATDRRLSSAEETSLSMALNARAQVNVLLGQLDLAEADTEQALLPQHKGENLRSNARTFTISGQILYEKGDLSGSSTQLNKALAIYRRLGDTTGLIRCGLILGKSLAHQKKLVKASEIFLELTPYAEQEEDEILRAIFLVHLGALESEKGNLEASIPLLEQALSTLQNRELLREEALARLELARAQMLAGNYIDANSTISTGIHLVERLRNRIEHPRLKLSFLSKNQDFFDLGIVILMKLHESYPDAGFSKQAFELSELSRSRLLLDIVNSHSKRRQRPFVSDTLQKLDKIRGEIETIDQALQSNQKRWPDVSPLQTAIEGLDQFKERFNESRASGANNSFASQPISVTKVQSKLLDKETALLHFHFTEHHAYAWIIKSDNIISYSLPTPMAIRSRAIHYSPKLVTSHDKPMEELGRILLSPAEEYLPGIRRLIVVPDEELYLIPFAALEVGQEGDLLIESFEIVISPSASTSLALKQRRKHRSTTQNQDIAIFGDPVYSTDDLRISSDKKKTPNNVVFRQSEDRLTRLKGTEREALAIAAMIDKPSTLLALGLDANRNFVLETNLAPYDIIHFATHGTYTLGAPGNTGIALSSINRDGESVQGTLTLSDILNLRLTADLVVLSSCESAIGQLHDGEGRLGLSFAFFSAGASSVVTSLWPVEDEATADFMTHFYQKILEDNATPTQALRATQLDFKSSSRTRNPFYWAGFVIEGDG